MASPFPTLTPRLPFLCSNPRTPPSLQDPNPQAGELLRCPRGPWELVPAVGLHWVSPPSRPQQALCPADPGLALMDEGPTRVAAGFHDRTPARNPNEAGVGQCRARLRRREALGGANGTQEPWGELRAGWGVACVGTKVWMLNPWGSEWSNPPG